MNCAFCGNKYSTKDVTTKTLNKQTRCPVCQRTRDEQLRDVEAYFAKQANQ